jgi:ABC-type branched-subunit amino acid transport system substrate-binding protein
MWTEEKMKKWKHTLAAPWLAVAIIGVLLVTGAVACGEGSEEPVATTGSVSTPTSGTVTAAVEEWNVPVLTVLTGPAAAFGLDREWSIKWVADQINATGGLNGAPVKITSYDTGMGDAAKAVTTMTEALGTAPLCILGPIDSTATQASAYLPVEEDVPFISAFDTPEDLAAAAPCGMCDGPFYGDTTQKSIAEWISLNPDIKTVVVLITPEMFAAMRAPATDAFAELGVEVLEVVEVSPPGALDLGPVATKVMAKNPDGYCCMLTGGDYGRLCKALYERGMTDGRRILSSFVALGADLFTVGEGFTEDTYIYDMVDYTSQDPTWVAYSEAYAAAHDGNLPYTPANYGGAQMMLALQAAIEELGITGDPALLAEERTKIRDFLLDASGISDLQGGTFSYENGAKKMTLYLYQIKDNKLSRVSEVTG